MSASQKIRDDVRQAISIHNKDKSTQGNAFSTLRGEADGPKKMIQAAAAIYRSNQVGTANFTPSQDQLKTYATVLNSLAESRKIHPQKDGTFTPEQYSNELSPEAVLRYSVDVFMKDKAPADDAAKQACVGEINNTILETYEGDAEKAAPAQTAATSAATYMTEEEFAKASSEEREAYLSTLDPVDQERYQQAFKNQDFDSGKYAGDFSKGITHEDPDWAHKTDDDDAKIQQGDIIEYLMKEVILASAEWGINKAGGFVGALAYEGTSAGLRKAKKLYRHWKYDTPKDDTPNPPPTQEPTFKDLFNAHNEDLNGNIAKIEEPISPLSDPDKPYNNSGETIHDVERRIARHMFDISIISNPVTKSHFENLQALYDSKHIDFMVERFGEGRRDEITQKFKNYTAARDAAYRQIPRPIMPNPEDPAFLGPELGKAFVETEKTTITYASVMHDIDRIKKQKNLFAEHYAGFMLSEAFRENPEFIKNQTKVEELLNRSRAEAGVLFYKAQKDRAEGKDIPSNETLIETIKGQRQASINKYNNDPHSTEPLPNEVKKRINPPTTVFEYAALTEEAKKEISAETLLNQQRADCFQRISELQGAAADVTARRNEIKKLRKRIKDIPEKDELKKFSVGAVYSTTRSTGRSS